MKNTAFVIDTNDTRMFYFLKELKNKGYTTMNLDTYDKKTPVIYCFSPSKRFTNDEISNLNNSSLLIAGNLPNSQKEILSEKNIQYRNILLDEVFSIENAYQTAEATLMLMIRATNLSLYDMKIAILGYGRLGKAIGDIFKRLGLNFSIYTNDYMEGATAHLLKCNVYNLEHSLKNYDVIVNTIPAKILTIDKLQTTKKSCYILDLASNSSCDYSDITALGLMYEMALGLPGKYSPKSSGKILADAVLRLKEVDLWL